MASQAVQRISETVPGGYVTREQVMDILQCSVSGVERRVRSEELKSKLFPAPGRRQVRYYTESSVMRLRDANEKKVAVRPPSQLRAVARRTAPEPAAATPWITLAQAALMSGLPAKYVKELCVSGKITAMFLGRTYGWRILRKSMDAYEG
jgi:hypothetical protein